MAVGLLCLLVYTANFRSISAGDTYPARYLPFAIWRWHTVLLDPITSITAQGRPLRATAHSSQSGPAFWIVPVQGGHVVSLYPLLVPVLVSPLYLPAVAYLYATGWQQHQFDRVARIMEKVSASLLTAVSAALFYLLLRRRTGPRSALLLTFAYAFGSTTWVISSQALWQHGVAELLVVCALLLLAGQCSRGRAVAAGVVLGLVVCNRPPDSLIAAALGTYGLWWARRFAPLLVAAALVPAVPLLVYNLGTVGHFAGAYGLVGKSAFFQHDLLSGLAGLLFSPARGLFVFSPFLLFVPFCLPRILRDNRTGGLAMAALAAVILQLLLYAKADWRQGFCWGPRWLTELVPLLLWMLAPALAGMSRLARGVFVLAVGAAIAIETVGAFWYTGASDTAIYAASSGPNPMGGAWKIQNTPFIAELRHAHAPFELTTEVRGFLDIMTTGYGAEGRQIELTGWALAGGHSPHEVIALLDGRPVTSTTTFSPRPDVTSTLGAKGPSGWSLAIPASHLKPGEHVVAILARAYQGGDTRLLTDRRFTTGKPDLASSARRAAELVAARQQPPGYWLTSHTTQPRFEHPKVEMNTYLPAVIVDVLSPVAKKAGLQGNLESARHFLTRQIESNGLVRYHGLPDAPTIGTLGCAITPDVDDTALAWRIAPAAREELLRGALRTFAAYRTADGLYRTWLAPRERYRCINSGADPDPADIGIQMHVFMLLSKADPPAASALCSALKRAVDDDRIWVYYKAAPLIPLLRQADLRQSGCPLQLPASRRQTAIEGQDLWISATRALQRAGDVGPHFAAADIRELLERIAEDDFLFLRRSPPLLYHNDQTASVSRFYWSEEFGYALWLRLYFELDEQAAGGAK
ncbi:MAG: hypothetical protein ACM336_19815 [Acidobacteriota bacterium]